MIKQFLITVFATIFIAGNCLAGSENSQVITNWGANNCGAQLSIGVSNNVVRAGSTTIFYTRTKNSSTNVIRITPRPLAPYFLTNSLGKVYQAVLMMPKLPSIIDANPPANLYVSPGEIREWSVWIKFDNDMEPGDYFFSQITEDITTVDGNVCTLMSNSLKVHIK
jgi:hypothetical protein